MSGHNDVDAKNETNYGNFYSKRASESPFIKGVMDKLKPGIRLMNFDKRPLLGKKYSV